MHPPALVGMCVRCVSQGGPQSILIRRQKSGLKHTEKEEGHVRMQAEVAGMCPQDEECLGSPGAGRGRRDPAQSLYLERSGPANTVTMDFRPPGGDRVPLHGVELPLCYGCPRTLRRVPLSLHSEAELGSALHTSASCSLWLPHVGVLEGACYQAQEGGGVPPCLLTCQHHSSRTSLTAPPELSFLPRGSGSQLHRTPLPSSQIPTSPTSSCCPCSPTDAGCVRLQCSLWPSLFILPKPGLMILCIQFSLLK